MRQPTRYLLLCLAALTAGISAARAQDTLAPLRQDLFLEGMRHFTLNETDSARRCFEQVLREDPDNEAACYYLGRISLADGDTIEAEHYLSLASGADSANYWYTVQLARLYAMTGRTDRAAGLYEGLKRQFPNRSTIYSDLISIYITGQQYAEALDVLDELESLRGRNEATGNVRFDLLRMQGKYTEAAAFLEEFEKKYPSPQSAYMLGELYQSRYRDSVALGYYEKALALDPSFTPAYFGMAEVYRLRRDFPRYFRNIRPFLSDPQMDVPMKADYLKQVVMNPGFIQNFQEETDSLVQLAVKAHPADSSIRYAAGSYLLRTGRTDRGVAIYRSILEQYPSDTTANLQYLFLLYYLQRWEELDTQCRASLGHLPGVADILQLQAISAWQLKQTDRAVDLYRRLLKALPENDEAGRLVCHSALGDLFFEKGNPRKAYAEYEKALDIDPVYLPVLNNYAYYLSLEGKSLKKARNMSRICVRQEPDNPTYLDTYGWILYLLGEYEEALAQFKHAMLYGGKESAVILDHYADTLYATGETTLAYIYWEQADRMDPGLGIREKTDRLKAREKKADR